MLDFIKSINSDKKVNSKEIYELFQTDSSEMNSKILSKLQKHKDLNEFFVYYSKLDFKNVLNLLDSFESLSSILSENTIQKLFNSGIDDYLFNVSKIIMSLFLIEKTSKVLNNLINTTQATINEFNTKVNNNLISININNCLNQILNYTQIPIQRSLSRRGTKEKTISSYNNIQNKRNSLFSEISLENKELILVDNNTPKFDQKELSNKSSLKENKENSNLKESDKTVDSILSLKNMKFLSDSGDGTLRGMKKKNKTIKIGFDRQDSNLFFKHKSNSNKINENSSNENDINTNVQYINSIDKSQILADLLNVINILFENNKINQEQKLSLKQLLISDSENVINNLFKFNENNFPFNSNLKSLYKKFLMSELKNM